MTRSGEKPTQESRKKARHSNPYSCPIKTPDGIFRSIHECAEHYHRTPQAIVHRCRMGEQQRKTNKQQTLHYNDWRGWEFWGTRTAIPKRSVHTPLGVFESITAAAKAHNMAICTLRDRCIKNINGYGFIEEEK